jgi:superfamily II DNA or RNA helicase
LSRLSSLRQRSLRSRDRRATIQVIDKFEGTFEGLWNDAEFALFTLQAFPFQLEILDRLAAERALHGRFRNLVVAATGTGKTVIAAFDYLRACERADSSLVIFANITRDTPWCA